MRDREVGGEKKDKSVKKKVKGELEREGAKETFQSSPNDRKPSNKAPLTIPPVETVLCV